MLTDNQIKYICRSRNMSIQKVKELIEACEKHGIEAKGDVFSRTPADIEELVKICKENKINIDASRTILKQKPDNARAIIKLCKDSGMRVEAQLFDKSIIELTKSVDYVRANFGTRYLIPSIIVKKVGQLSESMPVVKDMGLLQCTLTSPSILSLSADDIKERTGVLLYLGIPPHKVGKYSHEDRLNGIYALTNEKYENYCINNSISERQREYQKGLIDGMLTKIQSKKKNIVK